MPVDTFSAYRPVSIFLMTWTVADGLYRCQATKKVEQKLFKPTWIDNVSFGMHLE